MIRPAPASATGCRDAVLDAPALPGGGFAFVMATGIVSIAAAGQGLGGIATVLLAVNSAAYPLLVLLLLRRLRRQPAAILAELRRHRSAAAFLTIAAGTAVLGNQVVVLTGNAAVAAGLWFASLLLWAGLLYAWFALLTLAPGKPPPADGIDGGWLLLAVATEAPAILATHLGGVLPRPDIVAWAGLSLFLLGAAFYAIVICLIVSRWLLEPMPAAELTPLYWINMGAAAIATLAGARLVATGGDDRLLSPLLPALSAATLGFWAVATWWVPLLALLTVWRHTAGGVRLAWNFEWWSAVFPLGMYTAATATVARAERLHF